MLEERLDRIQRVQDQIDGQRAAEQIEALTDFFVGLVFEVDLQLTAQAVVAAL